MKLQRHGRSRRQQLLELIAYRSAHPRHALTEARALERRVQALRKEAQQFEAKHGQSHRQVLAELEGSVESRYNLGVKL